MAIGIWALVWVCMIGLGDKAVYNNSISAGFLPFAWLFHAIQFLGADAFEQRAGGFVVWVLFDQLTAESFFQDGLAQRLGLLQGGGEGLVELVGFGEFGFEFFDQNLLLFDRHQGQSNGLEPLNTDFLLGDAPCD